MSLNQQVIAEFSPCTPRAPQLRDLSIQTFRTYGASQNEGGRSGVREIARCAVQKRSDGPGFSSSAPSGERLRPRASS